MDQALLNLLYCPRDQGYPLAETAGSLECPTCKSLYPVVDGIVVIPKDARIPSTTKVFVPAGDYDSA
jgi:uncharacterized protein YbaR (Trm112 family)